MFIGNSLWQLIRQSDSLSWFIYIVLFCMSVICWAVFICKLILISIKKRYLIQALKRVEHARTLDDLRTIALQMRDTVPGYFLSRQLVYLKLILESRSDNLLSQEDRDLLQQHAEQVLDTLIAHEESYLPILSTCAAVAPLFGLLGTVWGLIHAFIGISERQTADIIAVAPGIAEALLTTLVGLLVAIPAVIMFNYLHTRVVAMEQLLFEFAEMVRIRVNHIAKL
jgi:biopolymer transport protein ExbB/TolQ